MTPASPPYVSAQESAQAGALIHRCGNRLGEFRGTHPESRNVFGVPDIEVIMEAVFDLPSGDRVRGSTPPLRDRHHHCGIDTTTAGQAKVNPDLWHSPSAGDPGQSRSDIAR
jgi:hypothetical protein